MAGPAKSYERLKTLRYQNSKMGFLEAVFLSTPLLFPHELLSAWWRWRFGDSLYDSMNKTWSILTDDRKNESLDLLNFYTQGNDYLFFLKERHCSWKFADNFLYSLLPLIIWKAEIITVSVHFAKTVWVFYLKEG